MNTKVMLVSGFLESGKTSYINRILDKQNINNEVIVVVQNEFGSTKIVSEGHNHNKIYNILNEEDIDIKFIMNIIKKYEPDRIFIELNGFENPLSYINLFNDKRLKKECYILDNITIIDAQKFDIYLKNMYDIIKSHIYNADTLIINNYNNDNLREIKEKIESINETIEIYKYEKEKNKYLKLSQKNSISRGIDLLITVVILFFILFLYKTQVGSELYTNFKSFFTVFVSIFIESIPFIIIGACISSVIQMFVSVEKFLNLFNKNIFISCFIASVVGIVLPVCDCSTILIVRGLIKKKINIGPAVTFLLAAPIVNPICIISTYIAFKGTFIAVVYRVAAAIIISNLVGIYIYLTTKSSDNILLDNEIYTGCTCTYCSGTLKDKKTSKLENIFMHIQSEFFYIGKFIIAGIFISSILQSIIFSKSDINFFSDGISRLIFMMILGFLLSVCSSSDAFIGKSFTNAFSLNSVMGFLVFGPMIDLKNIIILFKTFKKKFVIKLVFLTFIITFLLIKTVIITG